MEENKKPENLNNEVKTIHTYTTDMAEAVRDNETSIIKIALAEKDKREREEVYQVAKGTPLSKTLLLLGGLVFTAVAVITSYLIIKKNKESNIVPQAVVEIVAPISYDDKVFIDVTEISSQVELATAINKEVSNPNKVRSIKSIFLKEIVGGVPKLTTLSEFLSLMKVSAPQALTRNLDESYMIGVYTPLPENSDRNHLFLILKIRDYNQAYASMLTWEKTILSDMFALFDINVSGEKSELFEKPWADIVINNKDARILYDKTGEDILYYIFPDKNTLIITDNQDAIREIVTRLIARTTKPL
ncbi:MAG: hypothetical protein AAB477_00175 [Patescibacteria group bacterium]